MCLNVDIDVDGKTKVSIHWIHTSIRSSIASRVKKKRLPVEPVIIKPIANKPHVFMFVYGIEIFAGYDSWAE